jgi:hypothetical protein
MAENTEPAAGVERVRSASADGHGRLGHRAPPRVRRGGVDTRAAEAAGAQSRDRSSAFFDANSWSESTPF